MDKNGTVEDLLQEAANEVTDIHPGLPYFPCFLCSGRGHGEGRM